VVCAYLETEARKKPRTARVMAAAAYTLPVDRQSDWLVELERIVDDWDALPNAARVAVGRVLESVLADPASSAAEATQAHVLLARARAKLLRPA
jgi:hypothetical protein